jgi:hypothetical protein
MESQGEFHYGTGAITRAVLASRLESPNAVTLFDTSFGYLRIGSGSVSIEGSCSLPTGAALVQGDRDGPSLPSVVIHSGATWGNGATFTVHDGRAILYSMPTSLDDESVRINGGELVIRGGTCDHLYVNGGVLRHLGGTIADGYLLAGFWDGTAGAEDRTLTTLYQFGGESDFRGSGDAGKPGTFVYLGGDSSLPEESYSL